MCCLEGCFIFTIVQQKSCQHLLILLTLTRSQNVSSLIVILKINVGVSQLFTLKAQKSSKLTMNWLSGLEACDIEKSERRITFQPGKNNNSICYSIYKRFIPRIISVFVNCRINLEKVEISQYLWNTESCENFSHFERIIFNDFQRFSKIFEKLIKFSKLSFSIVVGKVNTKKTQK